MQELVKQFHEKYGFPIGKPMSQDEDCSKILTAHVEALRGLSKAMQALYQIDPDRDDRLWRVHLMMEELAEVMEAMARHNTVKVFHELCDLLYVVLGSGVTLDFPMEEGLVEIHAANMTKPRNYKEARVADRESRQKLRGPEYSPPNMEGVLKNYIRRLHSVSKTVSNERVCPRGHLFDEVGNVRFFLGEAFLVCPECGPQHHLLEKP